MASGHMSEHTIYCLMHDFLYEAAILSAFFFASLIFLFFIIQIVSQLPQSPKIYFGLKVCL